MKLCSGFVVLSSLIVVAGCTLEARRQDDMLVEAGFTETTANLPEDASALQ
jgi:hypothetical protein